MMLEAHQLAIFVPAAVIMAFIPGQDMLFVIAQSASGGVRRGLLAMAGTLTALFLVHLTAAAFGLSALLLKSALLFSAFKYAGAAYLLWLGIVSFLKAPAAASAPESDAAPKRGSAFLQGFVTNVLNPKIAIFILAFFPQFISPHRGSVAVQVFELGAIWGFAGLVALTIASCAGGSLGRLRRRSAMARRAERYVTGSIFIALGLRVLLPERSN